MAHEPTPRAAGMPSSGFGHVASWPRLLYIPAEATPRQAGYRLGVEPSPGMRYRTSETVYSEHLIINLRIWRYGSGVGFGFVFVHETVGVPDGVPVNNDEPSQLILPFTVIPALNWTEERLPMDTSR